MSNKRIEESRPIQTTYRYNDNGSFWFAQYEITDTPEELVRIGIAAPDASTRTGITPAGTPLANGFIVIRQSSRAALRGDQRFKAAMGRVMSQTPCPDFSLPTPKRRRKRTGPDAAGEAV